MEIEEEEEFDPQDPEMIPKTIEDVGMCIKVANESLRLQTGRSFPEWRSSLPKFNMEFQEISSLGVSIPVAGPLFYPCSGTDVQDPIDFFRGPVSEFHFADPFNPASSELRRKKGPDHQDIIRIPHLGNLVNANGLTHKLRQSDVTLVSHRKDGVLTLLDDLPALSVFYYRGDSPGEGGSDQWWMGPVLLDLVISRIMDGGLVCGDGSNGYGHFFCKLRDEPVGASFAYRNLMLTRLNADLPGKLLPMFVWQARVVDGLS